MCASVYPVFPVLPVTGVYKNVFDVCFSAVLIVSVLCFSVRKPKVEWIDGVQSGVSRIQLYVHEQ